MFFQVLVAPFFIDYFVTFVLTELKLLVRFATGTEFLPPPPYNLKSIGLKFQDSVVCGATCSRTLTIPLTQDYELFKAAILVSILDADSYNMY